MSDNRKNLTSHRQGNVALVLSDHATFPVADKHGLQSFLTRADTIVPDDTSDVAVPEERSF